jgi:hypothetical protein
MPRKVQIGDIVKCTNRVRPNTKCVLDSKVPSRKVDVSKIDWDKWEYMGSDLQTFDYHLGNSSEEHISGRLYKWCDSNQRELRNKILEDIDIDGVVSLLSEWRGHKISLGFKEETTDYKEALRSKLDRSLDLGCDYQRLCSGYTNLTAGMRFHIRTETKIVCMFEDLDVLLSQYEVKILEKHMKLFEDKGDGWFVCTGNGLNRHYSLFRCEESKEVSGETWCKGKINVDDHKYCSALVEFLGLDEYLNNLEDTFDGVMSIDENKVVSEMERALCNGFERQLSDAKQAGKRDSWWRGSNKYFMLGEHTDQMFIVLDIYTTRDGGCKYYKCYPNGGEVRPFWVDSKQMKKA